MKPLGRASALLLCCALALGLCAGAFARESADDGEATVGLSGAGEVGGVLYPESVRFVIDPYEKAGRGQVYSDRIRVVNTNPFPVDVEIQDPVVVVNGPTVGVSRGPVNTAEYAQSKALYLCLRRADRDGGEELVLRETPPREPLRFQLGPFQGERATLGSSGEFTVHYGRAQAEFELTGGVTLCPDDSWLPGDVEVSLSFAAWPVGEGPAALSEDEEDLPEIEPPPEDIDTPQEETGATVGTSGI